jgi:hypothetical protein
MTKQAFVAWFMGLMEQQTIDSVAHMERDNRTSEQIEDYKARRAAECPACAELAWNSAQRFMADPFAPTHELQ